MKKIFKYFTEPFYESDARTFKGFYYYQEMNTRRNFFYVVGVLILIAIGLILYLKYGQ